MRVRHDAKKKKEEKTLKELDILDGTLVETDFDFILAAHGGYDNSLKQKELF
jgi:hypothetical protein